MKPMNPEEPQAHLKRLNAETAADKAVFWAKISLAFALLSALLSLIKLV